MKRVILLLLALNFSGSLWADCQTVIADLKLPITLKMRGKPKTARWEQVEKVMTELRDGLEGQSCELSFGQVFASKSKKEIYFPLISNLLRTVPEESLVGVAVFSQDGYPMGHFENRVTYEKKGEYTYKHYYFQFRDKSGELHSSGNRLLIDIATGKPFFIMKWADLKDRIAVSTP
jgi:hypothetical protein